MDSFSARQSCQGPAAEVSIQHEASEALRAAIVSIIYQRGLAPSELCLVFRRNLACRVDDMSI